MRSNEDVYFQSLLVKVSLLLMLWMIILVIGIVWVVRAEVIPLNFSVNSSVDANLSFFGEGFNFTVFLPAMQYYQHNFSVTRDVVNASCSLNVSCASFDYGEINSRVRSEISMKNWSVNLSGIDEIVSKRCEKIYFDFKAWSEETLLPQQELLDNCETDTDVFKLDRDGLAMQVRSFNQTLNLTVAQLSPLQKESDSLRLLVYVLVGTVLLILVILIKGGHLGKGLPLWSK